MPSAKSKVACRFSAEALWRLCQSEKRGCFFWTFTFRNYHSPDQAQHAWDGFWKCVRRAKPGVRALKVIQPHPGGHGAHYHVLVDSYLHMGMLKRFGEYWGLGHMWVERVGKTMEKAERIMEYVSRYISRSTHCDEEWSNTRMWSKLGEWVGSRVQDMQCDCTVTRAIRAFRVIHGVVGRMPYWVVGWIVHLAQLWGEYGDWPEYIRLKFLAMLGKGSYEVRCPSRLDWSACLVKVAMC